GGSSPRRHRPLLPGRLHLERRRRRPSHREAGVMAFALKETLQGKDIWFRFWTMIGPCATAEKDERALFASKDEAMRCAAFTHSLSFYEPEDVGDGPGDLN